MEIIKQHADGATIKFSKDEFGMLRSATGGPAFRATKNRDIPVLNNWNKPAALQFEADIQKQYDHMAGDNLVANFSKKELAYLARIHWDNMKELDPIEYPTITGRTFEAAQLLLSNLQNLLSAGD